MFIKLDGSYGESLVSLHGNVLTFRISPDDHDLGPNTRMYELVIIHNPGEVYHWESTDEKGDKDNKRVTILAQCESDGNVGIKPLIPLYDKICKAVSEGETLFDLKDEKTYTNLVDSMKYYGK